MLANTRHVHQLRRHEPGVAGGRDPQEHDHDGRPRHCKVGDESGVGA